MIYLPETWVIAKVTIKEVPVEGYGLFAVEPIAAGDVIAIWGGALYNRRDLRRGVVDISEVVAIDEGVYPGGDLPDVTRHINHS